MYAQVRTTERIAAFIPGESPPEVKTPIFFISEAIQNFKGSKLGNFIQNMNALIIYLFSGKSSNVFVRNSSKTVKKYNLVTVVLGVTPFSA
jgi:hypothetical protein